MLNTKDSISSSAVISDRQLGSQLTLLVALGMFVMVLSVSIGTSIIINKSLTNNFIQNGKNITGVLAKQSSLPVLLGSPAFARQAIAVVHAFPSVTQVAIYELENILLAESGDAIPWVEVLSEQIQLQEGEGAVPVLEYDGKDYWQFSSPVKSDNAEPELEDLEATRKQESTIGRVRVLVSKDQLYSARYNIIIGNVIVLLIGATVLVLALNGLSGALTKPLEEFVETMASGARGERNNLRVDLSGSKETQQLSNAFNQMMEVLEDRELQLATARDHALAAAKLKAEFAANVSHEIRTPLNGILGTLNLLGDTVLNRDQKELITLAESSSEALMILINDILDFSRLSLDQAELSNIEFDLYQLLEELMFLHGQSADAASLDILTDYDSALPLVVESDPNKLRQLLNNLINNAVKFTDHGSVLISAIKEVDAQGKLWIRLAVRDTGIGISEKDLHRIFLPYSQSDGSMTRKYSGTGLGLSICEKLAELLHGDIGVHSDINEGSEFYVRIPFSYRPELASNIEKEQVYPLSDRPIIIYGSTVEIRKACQSLSDLYKMDAEICLDIASLKSVLEKLSSAANADINSMPTLMLYCSVDERFESVWSEVETLVTRLCLNTIVVSRTVNSDVIITDNILLTRPPLRASAFSAAMLSLLKLDQAQYPADDISHIADFSNYSVLLVEDNMVNKRVANVMLDKLGCQVVVAETGLEALEALEKQYFDLIYMDCQMPKMNGYDASRAIRLMQGEKSRVPIIAMTANIDPQDRIHCFDAGMNDFLSKPFKLEELSAMTKKWVGVAGL
jgi:signal transduction histidine kinase/ActR/RegA family two-component response regulator